MSVTAEMLPAQQQSRRESVRARLGRTQSFGVLLLLILVIVVTASMRPAFVGSSNISNIATNAALLAIVGFGMTYVIAIAGLDLSVGGVQALTAILAAQVASSTGVVAGLLVAVAGGSLVGVANGLISVRFAVPAFIATLGMASVVRGGALLHVNGSSVMVHNGHFGDLGSGRVLGVPVPVVFAVVVFLVLLAVLHHTRFGRHVIAVGGNAGAARSSGLHIRRITVAVYALSGATAGLSGALLAAQLQNVDGSLGQGFELKVIAVAVVGGASLAGGRANLSGTAIAAILIATIDSALNVLNVQSYYQYLAIGTLLILALTFDSLRGRITLDPRRAT